VFGAVRFELSIGRNGNPNSLAKSIRVVLVTSSPLHFSGLGAKLADDNATAGLDFPGDITNVRAPVPCVCVRK